MSELIPITLASIILAILSHRTSEYDSLRYRYGRKEKLFFAILVVSMILFCGLRTGYNDTGTYQLIYEATPKSGDLLEGIEWLKIGDNPGFTFTNRILMRLGFSTQSFLMFYAVITVGLNLWFFRKYSCNFPISIFLFVTFAGYLFTLAAIKQCMAMALCLLATDRALQKKYIRFVFWVFIAAMFHPYALMYLIVPFLTFRPWSHWTLIMLGIFAAIGFSMENLFGTVLDITDMLGENFDETSFTGEGVNPFRLAVTAVPLLISFFTQKRIVYENNREQNLFLNLTMLNAEIMFVALFGTANYFARLANYFLPFQAVTLPWLFTHFETETKKYITRIAVVCYSMFFIYSNMYTGSFDSGHSSISLYDYLLSLFEK